MSFALLLLLMMMLGGGFALAYARRWSARRVTEPSCGKCGYCVRGLESMTCPECGSDLREVGIVTPGKHKPMSTGLRVLVWLLISALPALILGLVAGSLYSPMEAITTRRRVIFLQAPYLNTTLQITAEGRQIAPGRNPSSTAPLTKMKIGLSSGGPLTIDLVSSQASYFDATEKRFSGPFDEKLITAWLNANGFTDPLVAERAKDVLPLINEIPAGAGGNFTYAAQDPARGNMHLITAHPATPPFTVYQHFAWTKFVPLIVSSATVLGGIPVVILLGKRIQSRENADQARAHP